MKKRFLIVFFTLLVSIDALTKALCQSALPGRDVVLIDNILCLRLVHNPGAAFSLFADLPQVSFVMNVLILICVAVYIIKGRMSSLARLSLTAVAAGGFANLLDRVRLGYVIDMISLEFIEFPIFNFADICITCGAVAFGVFCLFGKEEG